MSRPTQVVCDGCGKVKQDVNHWWVVAQLTHNSQRPKGAFVVWPMQDIELYEAYEPMDFCGQDCALKFISEQMGKMSQ